MLSDKTILITGAAGGLGSALALGCLRENAQVVLLDKNLRELEKIHDEADRQGFDKLSLVPLDLAQSGPEDFQVVADQIQSQFGGLDILVHCAVLFDGLRLLEQIRPHEWLEQMQVNLNAPWLLSSICLPLLRLSSAGHLVFMLDDLSEAGTAYRGAYGVSKHALHALCGLFSQECTDVTVLGINPGPMRSTLRQNTYHAENPQDQPKPERQAGKIIEILAMKTRPEGVYIDI